MGVRSPVCKRASRGEAALLARLSLAGVSDPGFQEGSHLSLTDKRGSLYQDSLYKHCGLC